MKKTRNIFEEVNLVSNDKVTITLPRPFFNKNGDKLEEVALTKVTASKGQTLLASRNTNKKYRDNVLNLYFDLLNLQIEEDVDVSKWQLTQQELDYLLLELHKLSYGQSLKTLNMCLNEDCENSRESFKSTFVIEYNEVDINDFDVDNETPTLVTDYTNSLSDGKLVIFRELINVAYKEKLFTIVGGHFKLPSEIT